MAYTDRGYYKTTEGVDEVIWLVHELEESGVEVESINYIDQLIMNDVSGFVNSKKKHEESEGGKRNVRE